MSSWHFVFLLLHAYVVVFSWHSLKCLQFATWTWRRHLLMLFFLPWVIPNLGNKTHQSSPYISLRGIHPTQCWSWWHCIPFLLVAMHAADNLWSWHSTHNFMISCTSSKEFILLDVPTHIHADKAQHADKLCIPSPLVASCHCVIGSRCNRTTHMLW